MTPPKSTRWLRETSKTRGRRPVSPLRNKLAQRAGTLVEVPHHVLRAVGSKFRCAAAAPLLPAPLREQHGEARRRAPLDEKR